MKIAVIVAGTNEPSNSDTMADAFIEGMQKIPGAEVSKIRLKDLSIDHFTLQNYHPGYVSNDDFPKVEAMLKDASAVVFATPIWNFSVPSHLKNLIDRMGAFALDEATHSKGQFKARPFALLYTGGAPMIAWKALMYLTTLHMTEAIKYYGGTVIYRHFEPKSLPGRGQFGLVVDKRPASLELMRRKGEWFGKAAETYSKTGSLPLAGRISYQFFTFLYRIGNRIMYPISTLQ
jgi:multimeric flavodoxin WrbA